MFPVLADRCEDALQQGRGGGRTAWHLDVDRDDAGAGWVLVGLLLPNLSLVTVGLAIGILQWFVLRMRFQKAWQWILAATVGWAVGSAISYAVPPGMNFAAGLLIGLSIGLAEWLVLRREVQWAGWWIAINIVAWTTGTTFLPGLVSTGAVVGLITAAALALLVNAPKNAAAQPS